LITVPLLALYFLGGRDTPQAFHLRCCTILNPAFRGGLEEPTLKEIHSLWNRPESLFLKMVSEVSFIKLDCRCAWADKAILMRGIESGRCQSYRT